MLKLNENAVPKAKVVELKPVPYALQTYETVNELKPSSSIEAVNLDSWPSSEPSPDEVKHSAISRRSAYFLHRSESEESLPSIGSLENVQKPIKKGGLLPPIFQPTPNLPGGINFLATPVVTRRKSDTTTIISRPSSIASNDSLDDTLAGVLTPPQDWLNAVQDVTNISGFDETLDMECFKMCLEYLITEEMVKKHEMGSKDLTIKILQRDVILVQKLKKVGY